MVFPKARLAVSAGLFLAWIGFLAYLVAKTRDNVILSRPQLLASTVVVIADVSDKGGRPASMLVVKKVVQGHDDGQLAGGRIEVEGLPDSGVHQGWAGAGEYIVPLTVRSGEGGSVYEVTPLPLSPGYVPQFVTVELLSLGPDGDKAAELTRKYLGGDGKVAKGVLRRNVSRKEAEIFFEAMKGAGAKVALREGDNRIYRNTPDAREQLAEINVP